MISQLLNLQYNYEWGLRNLINILKISVKLKERKLNSNEDFFIVHALR